MSRDPETPFGANRRAVVATRADIARGAIRNGDRVDRSRGENTGFVTDYVEFSRRESGVGDPELGAGAVVDADLDVVAVAAGDIGGFVGGDGLLRGGI